MATPIPFASEDLLQAAAVEPEQPPRQAGLAPSLLRLVAAPRAPPSALPFAAPPCPASPARLTNTSSLRALLIAQAILRRRPAFPDLKTVIRSRAARPAHRCLKRRQPRRGRDHPPCL